MAKANKADYSLFISQREQRTWNDNRPNMNYKVDERRRSVKKCRWGYDGAAAAADGYAADPAAVFAAACRLLLL